MSTKYSLYTLPLINGRLRKPEELPKESNLFDYMIHKATSEATAGKIVYLLAMDITETSLLRRIHCGHNLDITEIGRTVKGKFVACTPRTRPNVFDVPYWFRAVPEERSTVVIYGADMIFNSYTAAVKSLKKVQEIKNCEIIFAWRDEDMPAVHPPVTFKAYDELNIPHEKPIPVHKTFKVTKEDYYSNPKLMQDPLLLYCPAKELAYKLDPEDPRDSSLIDAFNSEKHQG